MGIEQQFLKAWTDAHNPALDSVNPHYKNRYTSLSSMLAVIRPVCEKNGIAYQQLPQRVDGEPILRTLVINDKGEGLVLSELPLIKTDNSQAFGSDLTYKKRQACQTDWTIVGEDDDDAEAAVQAAPQKPQPKQAPKQEKKQSSRPTRIARIQQLKQQVIDAGVKEEGVNSWFKANYKDKTYKDLTDADLSVIEKHLNTLLNDARAVLL